MALREECDREVLETIPLVMRTIREEMRKRHETDLSVPQFRALAYLGNNPNASLSDVAEHVGSALPSMSKLVDGLVTRGYVSRRESPEDRRRVVLALTDGGANVLATARKGAQDQLGKVLRGLSTEELGTVARAMRILRAAFLRRGGEVGVTEESGSEETGGAS
jgi:DNA-binding MarR family transcriptional regulator